MKQFNLSDFDDIRPYTDEELPSVMKRLVNDVSLTNEVAKLIWKKSPQLVKPLFNKLLHLYLKGLTRNVKTLDDFQRRIVLKFGMNWVVRHTIRELTVSGLENIAKGDHYLFISNHRDIILDSASLNYHLLLNNYNTAESAFGDNLMMNDIVTDLIRTNKSFIVKRGLPRREQYNASLHLAHYIWFTLNRGNSVWIAQDGGRSKNGDDRTNPGLIRLLAMAKSDSRLSFPEFVNACNIIPVAISYEFDPCEEYKANELFIKETTGSYHKENDEDLKSIIAGIKRRKGRVHVALAPRLVGNWKDSKEVASFIDRKIHSIYRLWPTNYIAFDIIKKDNKYKNEYTAHERDQFVRRIQQYPDYLREIIYKGYAKPVENREIVLEIPEKKKTSFFGRIMDFAGK